MKVTRPQMQNIEYRRYEVDRRMFVLDIGDPITPYTGNNYWVTSRDRLSCES